MISSTFRMFMTIRKIVTPIILLRLRTRMVFRIKLCTELSIPVGAATSIIEWSMYSTTTLTQILEDQSIVLIGENLVCCITLEALNLTNMKDIIYSGTILTSSKTASSIVWDVILCFRRRSLIILSNVLILTNCCDLSHQMSIPYHV